ncbi:MAG: hypothetical protein RR598_03115 [Anaerorhabdus sp.]
MSSMIYELWRTVETIGYYALPLAPVLMVMYTFSTFRKYNKFCKKISSVEKISKMKKVRNKMVFILLMLILNVLGITIMISNFAYILRTAFEFYQTNFNDFKTYLFMQGPQFIFLLIGLIVNIKLVFGNKEANSVKNARTVLLLYLIATLIQILTILSTVLPLLIAFIHWYLLKNKNQMLILDSDERGLVL